MVRFAVSFALLAVTLRSDWVMEQIRWPYCRALASSLTGLLRFVGIDVRHHESMLYVNPGGGMEVVPECDGLVLLALFIAGVIGMPLQRSLRPYASALACLLALVAVNWLRLLVLALMGFYYHDLFELVHHYVAQGAMLLVTVAVFLVWLARLDGGAQLARRLMPQAGATGPQQRSL